MGDTEMQVDSKHNEVLRTFQSSACARAAGYSTLAWYRAFTFEEHAKRIDISNAQPKWWTEQ
jgi:hypothetical protein